jgi:hypothetical protein
MSSSAELRKLGDKLVSDPDAVYDLTQDELLKVRKYINPLGNVVPSKKVYANMSIINWREKDMRHMLMTGLIGYLYRTLEEYECEDVNNELQNGLAASTNTNTRAKLQQKAAESHSKMRANIRKFLDRNFNYNPDYHLRSARSEGKNDPERPPTASQIANACKIAESAKSIESKLLSRNELTYKYMRDNLLYTYQAAGEATSAIKGALSVLLLPDSNTADNQGVLLKKYKQLTDLRADLSKIVLPLSAADTIAAWQIDPPADVYHHFDRYFTNHYEQLREVCTAVYNEKVDFEYAVILYDAFKTPEAAREHRLQHENEFSTEIQTIENSGVTLLGPFRENRDRLDFYNKNTEIMKQMMDQLEADHKLGKDLMEKRVKRQKKRNISECGPDAPGLAAYTRSMNTVRELGAKQVVTREEKEEMARAAEEAKAAKESLEVPDDAIQVDMFYPVTQNGVTSLEKTKFYTQAEAPLHAQEGSEFVDKYQPKRSATMEESYETREVVTNGKKTTVKVPTRPRDDDEPESY